MVCKEEGNFFIDVQQTFIQCKNVCPESKQASAECKNVLIDEKEKTPLQNKSEQFKILKLWYIFYNWLLRNQNFNLIS